MHLLLTDRLACPRCGPEHGLILVAHAMEDRRVRRGLLGCSNCREEYPVVDGVADLRPPPRAGRPAFDPASEPPSEESMKLAALLGVTEGPAHVLLLGPGSAHAAGLAAAVSELEVVAASGGFPEASQQAGVSPIVVGGGRLPFFSSVLRGVALDGNTASSWLDESVRVLAPGNRLVVTTPGESAGGLLEEKGLEVILDDPQAVVGVRK